MNNFCNQCGTKTKALHWPEDDYRCPNMDCELYDTVVDFS